VRHSMAPSGSIIGAPECEGEYNLSAAICLSQPDVSQPFYSESVQHK
jgi:hypothetical protein